MNNALIDKEIDKESPVPLYYQIKEIIKTNINGGPGSLLPSEHELAKKYSVSRVTARQAVTALVNENLAYRIRGKGTYVKDIDEGQKIKINYENKAGQVHQRISSSIKESFPFVEFVDTNKSYAIESGMDIAKLVSSHLETNAKHMLDLNSFIENDPNFELENIYSPIFQNGVVRNKRIALPYCFCPKFMIYNKELFRNAGIDFPKEGWKWGDFEKTLNLFDQNLKGKGLYSFGADQGINRWIDFIWQNEGGIFKEGKFVFNNTAVKDSLKFFKKINRMKKSPPEFAYKSFQCYMDLFEQGKLAMTISNRALLCNAKRKGMNIGMIHLPFSITRANHISGEYLGIPKNCSNPDLAWKVIKQFLSREVQNIIAEYCYHYPVLTEVLEKNLVHEDDSNILKETARSRFLPGIPDKNVLYLINYGLNTFFRGKVSLETCLSNMEIAVNSYVRDVLLVENSELNID